MSERLSRILAEYQQAVDAAAQAVDAAAQAKQGVQAKQEELIDANPDLVDELKKQFENGQSQGNSPTVTFSKPESDTASYQRGDDPEETLSPEQTTELSLDARRFGDYELLDEIAKGGMGVVYKARQVGLDRVVALKMIRSGGLPDQVDVDRFRSEAQAAAKMKHSGILPVFEVGEYRNQHFFTMELAEGGSLMDRLRDDVLPPTEAAEVVRKVAEAIEHAHEQGIIHRDLKPGNILLDGNGNPKVADFGLAKRMDSDVGHTVTGTAIGTPSYMAPEQAEGRLDEMGVTADVYSLGAVLYCLLTGRPPFRAATHIETLRQVIDDEPVAPRTLNKDIPKNLETICLKCLNKQPSRRYSSARELADDLGRWLNNEPIKARRVKRLEKSWLWCKRRPIVASLVALVLLIVGIGSGVFIERQNALHAKGLVDSLVRADVQQVSTLIDQIEDYQWWTKSMLQERFTAARDDSTEKLHLRLALLRFDKAHLNPLCQELLKCNLENLAPIRDELTPHKQFVTEQLWAVLHGDGDEKKRFRAGLALAKFVPNDDQWIAEDATFLVDTLLGHAQEEQPQIRNYLTEIKTRLYVDLKRAFRDRSARERQEIGSAKAFAQFAVDDIGLIADVAAEATVGQYKILYPLLEASSDAAVQEVLRPIAAQQPDEKLSQSDRVALGRRRAGAAISLLRKGDRQEIFDVFRVTDDPESLTQFVHRCRERGVTAAQLLDCLDQAEALRQTKAGDQRKREDRVLFGLLLALGEFAATDVPSPQREELVSKLVDWYASDPSSTIHGATGWLLRHWGYKAEVEQIDQTEVPYAKDREWFIKKIDAETPCLTEG